MASFNDSSVSGAAAELSGLGFPPGARPLSFYDANTNLYGRSRSFVAWIIGSSAAGALVGWLPCPTNPVVVLAVLGLAPACAQVAVLVMARAAVKWWLWVAATTTGAYLAYGLTYVAFVLQALALSGLSKAVGAPLWLSPWPTAVSLVVLGIASCLGGVGLGWLQYLALPRSVRTASWVVATMLGAILVAPIATIQLQVFKCDASLLGLPLTVLGSLCGLGYGFVTLIPLSRVLDSARGSVQRP